AANRPLSRRHIGSAERESHPGLGLQPKQPPRPWSLRGKGGSARRWCPRCSSIETAKRTPATRTRNSRTASQRGPLEIWVRRVPRAASGWRTPPSASIRHAWQSWCCPVADQSARPCRRVLDQVEIPVGEQQPDIDLRVSGQELSDDGQDMQAPKK